MGEKIERILWAKHPDALLELAIAWHREAGRIHGCGHCIENSDRLQRRWDELKEAVTPYEQNTQLWHAWYDVGPRPDVHYWAKNRLQRDWPSLHHAIVATLNVANTDYSPEKGL